MIYLSVILGTCALFIGLLMYIVCRKQPPFLRSVGLFLFALCLAIIYGFSIEMLSHPKPIEMELFYSDVGDVKILDFFLKEDVGIYLWVTIPGVPAPRYYFLPWDMQTAQRLTSSSNQGEPGSVLVVVDPFRGDLYDQTESPFQNRSQRPHPPKVH